MDVGLQLAPTRVIVGVEVLLPPPQATSSPRQYPPARIPRIRRIRASSPLLDLGDIYTLGHHRRDIGPAMEAACVSTLLKDEAGGLHKDWAAPMTLLRRHGLFHRLEIGTQQLLQVGLERPLPRHTENGAVRSHKFAYQLTRGKLDFVADIALGGNAAQRALHVRFVVLHGGNVVA